MYTFRYLAQPSPKVLPLAGLAASRFSESMVYELGAGFSFAFLSTVSEMGFFLPFPNVHDFLLFVSGSSNLRISR